MTCKPNPPVTTHQPGVPADSASCEKSGGSPKPPSQSLHDALVQCHANNGPIPKIGDLVWARLILDPFVEAEWLVYVVVDQREHKFGGPEYAIFNPEIPRSFQVMSGSVVWQRYDKLYMLE